MDLGAYPQLIAGGRPAIQTAELLAAELHLHASAVADVTDQMAAAIGNRCAGLLPTQPVSDEDMRRALQGANRAMSKLCLDASQRQNAQAGQALAFDRLGELTRTLGPDAEIPDVLAALADVLAGGCAGPAVAYSIDAEDRLVLAARSDGGKPDAWRALAIADDFNADTIPEAGKTRQAMTKLLADPVELADWLDPCVSAHEPLLCAGRWIGGLLLADDKARKTVAALAGAMGLALGFAQGRHRAARLGEDLASASQVLRQAHDALTDARTLSMLAQMAAGAAHEMNTPLAVISGRAQLRRDRATDETERKTWQTIADQAHRISDIVSAMMELASPREPNPEALDAGELLSAAIKAFSNSEHPQAARATVDIDVAGRTPAVWGDRDQVLAMLLELMANASTAAAGSPRVHLTAASDDANGAVLLTVRDEGPGMDHETAVSAFTPFFSRQAAGRRLGLGLARVRRYAELNGGRVRLHSRPDEGTTVCIRLQAAG
jgi:signal transduction histidine kinase